MKILNLEFFDTTLRDGAQAENISFSNRDKQVILTALDDFGIDLIEGGDPHSNPKDEEFFATTHHKKLVAFGSTRHPNGQVLGDMGLLKLLDSETDTICIYGKCSPSQVKNVLNTRLDNNLDMIAESISFLRSRNKRVIFDAEHFFDGYTEDPIYAKSCLVSAFRAGADTIVLCDTNGASTPQKIYEITKEIVSVLDGAKIGIHCHNDMGLALAGTMSAISAGAVHCQGTFLGFGERCGNLNLSTLIALLSLNIDKESILNHSFDLTKLTSTAHKIAEIANITLDPTMPFVGAQAFTHKAGTHLDGLIKNPDGASHINPQLVGNNHKLLLSEIAGRAVVCKKLENRFPNLDKSSPKVSEVLSKIKDLEKQGYQFENADASFAVLSEKIINDYVSPFEILSYDITKQSNMQSMSDSNKATITVKVGGETTTASEFGNGPVNAIDKAVRSALTNHFPELVEVQLIDYKVRVVDSNQATGAVVRVAITSTDNKTSWSTVGVSTDIITASYLALIDSLEFKLLGAQL